MLQILIAMKKENYLIQELILLQFLTAHTATATMACKSTGLSQKNVCRYKRKLEANQLVVVLFEAKCRITGRQADYLTADPRLVEIVKNRKNG